MQIHGTACTWATAKVDEIATLSDSRYIFGYGSLLWNPGFAIVSAVPGKLRGYKRRFWNKSADHRGTSEYFGLVVCLVKADFEDEVGGVLYEIDPTLRAGIIESLDIREKYGYIRRLATCLDPSTDDPIAQCFVYCACTFDLSIDVFLHPMNEVDNSDEEIAAIAEVINRAIGPSGSNRDYLFALRTALSDLGISDSHVDAVYASVCIKTTNV